MILPRPQIRVPSNRTFRTLSAALLAGLAVTLAGCASAPFSTIGDSIPASMGGLTPDTPDRPATPVAYPAVHDMPPPRANTTLSAEEQIELEKQLTAVRVKQDIATGAQAAKKPAPRAEPRVAPASSTDSIY
jgi:hypothetical protein